MIAVIPAATVPVTNDRANAVQAAARANVIAPSLPGARRCRGSRSGQDSGDDVPRTGRRTGTRPGGPSRCDSGPRRRHGWWCSPGPASPPTRASPTSVARTGCGRRTRRPRRRRTSSTTSAIPRCDARRGCTGSTRRCGPPSPIAGHQAIVELERRRHAARARHPEHRRAAPGGRHRPRARDRGARHGAVDPLLELRRPAHDARNARPGARRRGRPALPGVRRHPEERHHQLRPAARARGDRPGAARSARSAT